jgi:hypothetical protein
MAAGLTYEKIFEQISHWHEHEIHDRIGEILGYDTWRLGSPYYKEGRPENEEIDLLITFPTQEDYEKCADAIAAVLKRTPE